MEYILVIGDSMRYMPSGPQLINFAYQILNMDNVVYIYMLYVPQWITKERSFADDKCRISE